MTTGFIILRHTNSEETNKYWQHSYHSIRKFYPDIPIVILDDNSNPDFVSEIPLTNTKIVHTSGDDVGSGEILPYIYFYRNKWFDRAVIIHDGVFMNSHQDFSDVTNYQFMWHFESYRCAEPVKEIEKLSVFNDVKLIEYHTNNRASPRLPVNLPTQYPEQNKNWEGCFGIMGIITHDFITKVYSKYNLDLLIPMVKTRQDRMNCERVIASIFQYTQPPSSNISKFGRIHAYCPWGVTFRIKEKYNHLPVIKVWTGR
tara:strand:- start:37 stop:807 length:771 start_codon:yes stop_codon:yes gene_type:complete